MWHFIPSLPPQTKVWSTMGVMYGRLLFTLSSFFITTCPINVVCLMQGRFPGGSASIAKWTRRQSQTVEERYDFYFFLFLQARKRAAGADLQCRTGASAGHWVFRPCAFFLCFSSPTRVAFGRYPKMNRGSQNQSCWPSMSCAQHLHVALAVSIEWTSQFLHGYCEEAEERSPSPQLHWGRRQGELLKSLF